ncbi:MAG: Hpt domain-containing protein, partial [Asticcacaulis sp.]
TRLAGSLCKMTDDAEKRALAPRMLVEAHLDAIRACVRDKIKEDSHPMGKILSEELESRVKDHLEKIGMMT